MSNEFIQIGCEGNNEYKFVKTLYLSNDTTTDKKVYEIDGYKVTIKKSYDLLSNSVYYSGIEFDTPDNIKVITCSFNPW